MIEITAAVLRDPAIPMALERLTLDGPGTGEVLVRVVACGMCHTDGLLRTSMSPAPLPVIPGHEGAGVVEAVGPSVEGIEVGDHVVLSFDSCGACRNCTDGRPALCRYSARMNLVGRPVDGSIRVTDGAGEPVSSRWFAQSAFATYAVASVRNAVVIDRELPLELMGPLGCGIQTGAGAVFNSLGVQPGSTVAVFGTGAVGMAAVMASAVAGAATIIAVDLHAARLELAMDLGATHAIDGNDPDAGKRIRKLTSGDGADYAVEATGVPAVAAAAIAATRTGGTCALAGILTGKLTLNPMALSGKTVVGVVEGDSVPQDFIPKLIELWRAGRLPFDRVVEYFPLEQINEAEEASASGRVLKPVLLLATDWSRP